jgi:hypothetical protein
MTDIADWLRQIGLEQDVARSASLCCAALQRWSPACLAAVLDAANAFYSITSSARMSKDEGMVRPNASTAVTAPIKKLQPNLWYCRPYPIGPGNDPYCQLEVRLIGF